MKIYCLSCSNEWISRGSNIPRQCPSCWGRILVTEDELRLAALVCHLLANLAANKLPPPPSPVGFPRDVISFPLSLKTYHDLMNRTNDQSQRRRAAKLMLEQRGIDEEESSEMANAMFP